MADKGFETEDKELQTFAESLEKLADNMAGSAGAMRGLSYGPTTYGLLINQIFGRITEEKVKNGAEAVERAVTNIRDASTGVKNTSQLYQDIDGFLAEHAFGGGKK